MTQAGTRDLPRKFIFALRITAMINITPIHANAVMLFPPFVQ